VVRGTNTADFLKDLEENKKWVCKSKGIKREIYQIGNILAIMSVSYLEICMYKVVLLEAP